MAVFIAGAALFIAFIALWYANRVASNAEQTLRDTASKEIAKLREMIVDRGNDLIAAEARIEALETTIANIKVELEQNAGKTSGPRTMPRPGPAAPDDNDGNDHNHFIPSGVDEEDNS